MTALLLLWVLMTSSVCGLEIASLLGWRMAARDAGWIWSAGFAIGPFLAGLAAEGRTMLVVTHEMGFAREVADRVLFIDQGCVAADAPPDVFFGTPATERSNYCGGKASNLFRLTDAGFPVPKFAVLPASLLKSWMPENVTDEEAFINTFSMVVDRGNMETTKKH